MDGVPRSRGRSSRRWREVIRPGCRRRDEQANAPCWICGQSIDYSIPDGEPESWSPDHVYPVVTHRELAEDPGNIRASHLSCNKSRGDSQSTGASIGLPSRAW